MASTRTRAGTAPIGRRQRLRTRRKSQSTQSALPNQEWRLWIGFGAMCLGMFMAILDIQIVATSLPAIRDALNVSADKMSWLQTSYLIAEVIAIPMTGFLTRALSLRGLFVSALSIFTVASIGCAVSQSFEMLIFWRVVQGLAGGCLIPLVFSAVFLLFRDRNIAIATTTAGVLAVLAPSIGPTVGGYITQTFSWHWLFLINVLPGIAALIAAVRFLPQGEQERGLLARLDWPALVLLAVSLASLEIALKEAPQRGWLSGLVIALIVLALAAGSAFVRRMFVGAEPVANLRLLLERNFAIACALSFVLGIGLYGSVYLMPVFLGLVRDHGPLGIGEIMLVTGVAQLIFAPVAVQLDQKTDARLLTGFGFLFLAIGMGMSAFQTRLTDYNEMFWPQVVRGAAIMFCLLPPTRIALGQLSPDQVPDGSALFNLMRNLGGAIGIAMIDTLIWQRTPLHADRLGAKVMAGDAATADLVGIPAASLAQTPAAMPAPETVAMLKPLVEKAALAMAVNEAWALVAGVTLLAVLLLPFVRRTDAVAARAQVAAAAH